MNKSPCKNCEQRQLECHAHCKNYKEYREEIDYMNRKKQEESNKYIKRYDKPCIPTKQYKVPRW